MKKVHVNRAILALLSAVILAAGCKKFLDFIKHPALCAVRIIKYSSEGGALEVTYNGNGNPVSMLELYPQKFFEMNHHFRYDKYNRLTDYIDTYDGTGAMSWHTYTYKHNNKTVIDTTYFYEGDLRDSLPPYNDKIYYVTTYELDNADRIIKVDGETIYKYDDQGNLLRPGFTYDDKVNVYQTNKVWQFLFKDYSVNNAIAISEDGTKITAYNEFGLPLKYDCQYSFNCGMYFGRSVDNLTIEYDCPKPK